jgi:hypothetical protein
MSVKYMYESAGSELTMQVVCIGLIMLHSCPSDAPNLFQAAIEPSQTGQTL